MCQEHYQSGLTGRKVFATLNNEVKECWLLNFKVLWTKDSTVDYLVYTDIAGFTMIMTSATISVHYDIQKSACINKLCLTCAEMCKD